MAQQASTADIPAGSKDAGTVTGGCHCGACEWQVTLPTATCGFCHCKFCRSVSGAPFGVVLTLPIGQTKWNKAGQRGVFHQSDTGVRYFCKNCGTTLGSEVPAFNMASFNYTTIKSGQLDRKPSFHMNLESKADFYQLPDDGLPRYQAWPDAAW
eukprot:TRINITY_DN7005_c0_g2_i1.p1 TRINITY_DN7005_c0_g2~~TRINITY_DN7005_c0_g2_i1.p1  ORF type:complete len:154 (+),score=36.51 TRINITY_DN7005_c0_g2_i1:62-523(+)